MLSIAAISLSLAAALCADPIVWNTDQIPLGASTGIGSEYVTVASGPNAGEAVAAWSDSLTQIPYYSIYSNGTWTTGAIPIVTETASRDVYITAGPTAGSLVATWSDFSSLLYFSVYNGTSWTPVGLIPLGTSGGTNDDVFVTAGPNDGEVIAAWKNTGPPFSYYSIYSGGTWTTNILSSDANAVVYRNVYLCAGPTPGTMFATWKSIDNLNPYYSIYSGGVWSAASQIAVAFAVDTDVVPVLNPITNEVSAVWVDDFNQSIYFSTYSAGAWSTPANIPLGASMGAYQDVFIAAEATGQLVVTWSDSFSFLPYFSVYDGGVWSDGAPIPPATSTGVSYDVTVARLSTINTMIAAWVNSGMAGPIPYSSTFVGPPIPPPPPPPPPPVTEPLPPTNGQSSHTKDRFALLVEWYNQLNWTASTSTGVTGYNIRRNGVLIAANVPGTSYRDSDVSNKGTNIYRITSVNAEGTESLTALEITVTKS